MPRNLETVRHVTSLAGDELAAWPTRSPAPRLLRRPVAQAVQRRLSVGPEEAGSQASTIANHSLSRPAGTPGQHRGLDLRSAVISDGATDLFVVVPDDMIDEVRSWLRLWITIPNAIPNRRAFKRDLLLIIDEMPRLGSSSP